jgi:hypothetical protein
MLLKDAFYIMETSPHWYQARMTSTHFCFSAGSDLQKRLDGITRLVANHKDETDILISQLNDDGSGSNHMSPATVEQHKAQYSERGHLYDEEVFDAVQKGLKLRKQNNPMNKVRSRIKVKPKTPQFKEVEKRVAVTVPPLKKVGKVNTTTLVQPVRPLSQTVVKEKTSPLKRTGRKTKPIPPLKKVVGRMDIKKPEPQTTKVGKAKGIMVKVKMHTR